ncbi:FUSC family protein [Marivirga aurantiaca]|uniref:FUSC family protein n=1 Tax=Marivirga aurantiaca TaxID=2802615 RepID=UPI00293D3BD6|nr:FUSC family membrane protein [Marivirga aurantiaca]
MTFGIVLPIIIGISLDMLPYFLSVAIGMFLTSSSDVPGSRRHKSIGILTATLIAMLATIVTTFAAANLYILLPIMAILVFAISFISVYGFRASLISFSGLLAIVLSFAHKQTGIDILIHTLLIGAGGLWSLLLSVSFHPLLQKRQINNGLTECLSLTAKYIRIRGKLAIENTNESNLKTELYDLQVKINDSHESLRELLLNERQTSGFSNFKRKQLLIFIELIDILELSLANPANYERINKIFEHHEKVTDPFIELVFELSNRLEQLALCMGKGKKLTPIKDLEPIINRCRLNIQDYIATVKLPQAREGALLLHNLLDYEEKQLQKIQSIERIYQDLESNRKSSLRNKEGQRFITHQDYDLNILRENFSFKSPIFKHSARLTIAMLVGFSIGIIFSIQNAYWILLTMVVIMRPGYTLTKERSKHRLYGTLIGAGIAAVIVLLTQNTYVYAMLSVISLMLALSFIQKNYRTSSIFITLSVIFIYALIKPDAFEVIEFRVLDTLTGALIAMLTISFLWPAWESSGIKSIIVQAIKANRNYLTEINNYYHHQKDNTTAYKLARKEAFLEMGNLNAAFQRMSQEPKSRQQNLGKIYEIVGLNHTFLAAVAALGTFILSNKNKTVSHSFELIIESIDTNLTQALQTAQNEELIDSIKEDKVAEAYGQLEEKYNELVAIRTQELEREENKPIDPGFRKNLQEARLISDQLKWLVTISGSLKKAVIEFEGKKS